MKVLIPKISFSAASTKVQNRDGTNSIRYKPLKTFVDKNGNTLDTLSLSIHDREQNAVNSNIRIKQFSARTKKITAGLLIPVAIGLGVGGLFYPPLLVGAASRALVSAALFAWGSHKKADQAPR